MCPETLGKDGDGEGGAGARFREKSRSWIWGRVTPRLRVACRCPVGSLLTPVSSPVERSAWSQELEDTVLNQGKAQDTYFGRRIAKFIFKTGREVGLLPEWGISWSEVVLVGV